jgi:hypothetical protein
VRCGQPEPGPPAVYATILAMRLSAPLLSLIAVTCLIWPSLATAQAKPPDQSAPTRIYPKKEPQKVTDHSSGCHGLEGGEVHKLLGDGYTLNIRPAPSEMEALCFVDIIDRSGHALFELNEFAIGLHDATGKDIDGDGKPDLVIEATTGGHCCFTYAIVSLTPPRILARIRNEYPIDFSEKGGHIVLSTRDGAFDYFQGFFSASPRADVYLRFEGGALRDVSAEFREEHDHRIAEARARLTQQDLDQFHTSGPRSSQPDVHAAVLTVVLEYLYSGREEEAWQALADMWPPASLERTKKLILDTKARGILAPIIHPAVP